MGKYFGTDGFRGEAGITLTADHAYKVGRFLGWYYNALRERNGNNEPARIVIGKDTRRSSYMFEYSLVAGLTASGADAYLLHVTTTPSVAYIARVDDFDCGIMISASHNPYYDNGIKLIDCYGEKMPEEILLLVEDYIDGKLHVFDKDWPELPFAHREHIGCTVDYVAGRNRYMGYLISLGIYSFKGVKVGLDCANGASWNIAKSVFDALGADTYVINNKPNGLNINNNAGSTHIEGLQKFVVEKGLDIGFAYDGDADRCLCVDEKGNVITGDHILYIYGCYMKERGKLLTNTVVTTVMSNFGLYKAFDKQGIGYAKTAVGDKYVYEYMAKNGCRIGGEQSGHIIFSKYASTGDGILTSLKMMEVMLAKKQPMSKLAEPLKIYPQVLENVRVTDKKAAQDDKAVQAAVKDVAEALGMPILYSCHPRSRKRLEASGFQLDRRVIRHEPLGFHDYNCLQMNAFCVVSDSGTLPEESSFFTSVGHPFPAVCIRTSTERPEALDKGDFILAGIDEKSLLQAVDTAVEMNQNGDHGIPVPDYVEENVSTKVVKIIQSYTGVVNKMVWRKF